MKRYVKLLGLLMIAGFCGFVSIPSMAQSSQGDATVMRRSMMQGGGAGYEMGHPMMGAYGTGPYMTGWGYYAGLKLSADQKAKLSKIRQDARKKQWDLMEKMYVEREKLQELYEADKLDTAAINQQHEKVDALRREMRMIHLDAGKQIESMLTPEQREKSKRWGRGYHMMMWGY